MVGLPAGRARTRPPDPPTDSAEKPVARGVFCINCGSSVFTNNLRDGSGIVYVQEGTVDRLDEWLAPQIEIFTWSRQESEQPLDVPQFDQGPS